MIPAPVLAGLAVASFLGGGVRGATGFGGALFLAPYFALLAGPREATILIVLIHAMTCLQGLRACRSSVRWPVVVTLSVIAVACSAVFTRLLDSVDTGSAKRITGCVVVALALIQLTGWRLRHRGGVIAILLTGLISGAFTAGAGAGGPPAVVYFTGAYDDRKVIRANLLAYFILLYTLSAAVLGMQGRITTYSFLESALLAPLFFAGSFLGERLFHRLGDHQFDRLVAAVLAFSGAILLFL